MHLQQAFDHGSNETRAARWIASNSNDVRLLFVTQDFPPSIGGIQPYCRELERAGIPFVTCEPTFSPRLFVRGEGHPNGKMNEIWAEWMAPLVRDALAQR